MSEAPSLISSDPAPAQPLVSGTIIFLNGERFIDEAIRSVLAQTYENWELMLVDDGSTDGSTAIARSYAERYPEKIRYLEHAGHQNRGMSASRNLGVKHSQGEYIALLDADDVWEPNKLAEQVALLDAHPQAALLYGRTLWWFGWTGKAEDIARDRVSSLAVEPNTLVPPPELLARMLRNDEDLPCTCSILIRRSALNHVGGFEENFRDQFEDMVCYVKLLLEYPVYVAEGCWDRYRQHADNNCVVAVRTGQYHPSKPNPARKAYLEWIAGYLAKKDLTQTPIARLVEDQRWPYLHPVLHTLAGAPQRVRAAVRLRTRLRALITALWAAQAGDWPS